MTELGVRRTIQPTEIPSAGQTGPKEESGARRLAPAAVVRTLTIDIMSFSYRKGYPHDDVGHGGGFVFDCRFLPNPGREARFARFTGLDPSVADWLKARDEVARFVTQVLVLLEPVLRAYEEREFTSLSVAFGCTGGRHRSVYCAEELARHLRERDSIVVAVRHCEQPSWSAGT